jgi:hypothetical protein
MFNFKVLVNAALATATVLSLGFIGQAASAQSILITRGPGGAASIVDSVPVGATVLPTTPSQGFPNLVTRGPGGAAHIVEQKSEKMMTQAHDFPKLMTYGPNGASHLVN